MTSSSTHDRVGFATAAECFSCAGLASRGQSPRHHPARSTKFDDISFNNYRKEFSHHILLPRRKLYQTNRAHMNSENLRKFEDLFCPLMASKNVPESRVKNKKQTTNLFRRRCTDENRVLPYLGIGVAFARDANPLRSTPSVSEASSEYAPSPSPPP